MMLLDWMMCTKNNNFINAVCSFAFAYEAYVAVTHGNLLNNLKHKLYIGG